jgi:hypothetical protein
VVAHRRAAGVADENRHVVLDRDLAVEDVPVADVAAVGFGIQVQFPQRSYRAAVGLYIFKLNFG